jgi:hypothetical protein
MANTFIQIGSTVTVGAGGAANISFTGIPSTYTDLCLKSSVRCSDNVDYGQISFNTSTANFSSRRIEGDSASAISASRSDSYIIATYNPSSTTSSTFNNMEFYIPNYAGSANKSFQLDGVFENNATGARMTMNAFQWAQTAAINAISFAPQSGTFVQYSTATLYGISKS